MIEKDKPILVLGAGVFGLSSALHLREAGYSNITIFDRHFYLENEYDSLNSTADAASCDLNKIIRASYGSDHDLQTLAFEAMKIWDIWNATNGEKLFERCGYLRLDDHKSHQATELNTLATLSKQGLRATQFDINDPKDINRANSTGWGPKLDAFGRLKRGQHTIGVLDTTAGLAYASKACLYVLGILQKLGVKLVLGGQAGTFKEWYNDENDGTSVGFKTHDGKIHKGAQVIVAAGPWTPSIIPELQSRIEATAGNVAIFKIPDHRTDLLRKYSPENFPVIIWKGGHELEKEEGGGIYIFPATPDGLVKIGLRGNKWTNPDPNTGLSTPVTVATSPMETKMPQKSLETIKNFIRTNMPDIVEEGIPILKTRLCWYTDSYDNNWFICKYPRNDRVIICTGGSGHGFKFLPVLGKITLDVLEGRHTIFTERFKWRDQNDNIPQHPVRNPIQEGSLGPRTLYRQVLADSKQFKL